ncbi:multidrug resistance-associated protein 5 [Tanacetum coccineum]
MVAPLPFTVNLYHDGLFQVNPLDYVHFDNRVIDNVSFDGMSFKDFLATIRRLVLVSPTSMYYKIPSDPVTTLKLLKNDEDLETDSDSDGETNVPLDDVAHVVEQFEHENEGNVNIPRMTTNDPWLNKLNDHNKLLAFCGRDVSEGKCAGLKGKKPKTADVDECETSKQVSKKGDGRKVVNETLSKVKERWNKKKEIKKKRVSKQGNCPFRAKQCALFDHGGGLVDHYSKLWQYRQAILDTNPGSTCVLENEVNDEDGKLYFGGFYVCFHGVKQGWLEDCRKIIGLDGFKNNVYWSWFLSLIRDDLNLRDGGGINIISARHKGLLQAVVDWLPNAKHRQFSLSTKIEEIKMLDEKAHEWLVEKNPNLWCKAYFQMDKRSAAFENGISKSFNSRIVGARSKPIITMLEDIRVYIMQMMFSMNKLSFDNKDSITPSVRRHMEYKKRIQSAYKEVEVRKGDQAFGVNLHQMKCVCNMWQLSGIPCVHAMAGYMHMKMNPDYGVAEWYSQYRKMHGRPRKRRIRHLTEDDDHVPPRVGRVMHCNKCWETGHNKTRCLNQETPKPAYLRSIKK